MQSLSLHLPVMAFFSRAMRSPARVVWPYVIRCSLLGIVFLFLLSVFAMRSMYSAPGLRLFVSIVNRRRDEEVVAKLRLRDASARAPAVLHRLWHEDPLMKNTTDEPNAIAPQESRLDAAGPQFEIALPPHSYSILDLPLG